jgi:hypothetical protein
MTTIENDNRNIIPLYTGTQTDLLKAPTYTIGKSKHYIPFGIGLGQGGNDISVWTNMGISDNDGKHFTDALESLAKKDNEDI